MKNERNRSAEDVQLLLPQPLNQIDMRHAKRGRIALITLCLWASLAAFALAATQVALGDPESQILEDGKLGAVASENKICSQIGIDLLKAGGNAADAVGIAISRVTGKRKLIMPAAGGHCLLCRSHRYGVECPRN